MCLQSLLPPILFETCSSGIRLIFKGLNSMLWAGSAWALVCMAWSRSCAAAGHRCRGVVGPSPPRLPCLAQCCARRAVLDGRRGGVCGASLHCGFPTLVVLQAVTSSDSLSARLVPMAGPCCKLSCLIHVLSCMRKMPSGACHEPERSHSHQRTPGLQ